MLSLCIASCSNDTTDEERALITSLQGTSAYGAPLAQAEISIFSNGEWHTIGKSNDQGKFSVPANENVTVPTIIRAQLTSEIQLAIMDASENAGESLNNDVQSISHYGVILNNQQNHVSITPWSTATISKALGKHIATASNEEISEISIETYEKIFEISYQMQEMLASYFDILDIPEGSDPLAMQFSTNGTGFDGILDMFEFSIELQTGSVVVNNKVTRESSMLGSQVPLELEHSLFDHENQNFFNSNKISEWQNNFTNFFNNTSEITIQDIIDEEYINNNVTVTEIQEELESYKNNGVSISIHLPRIQDCDSESAVCAINAKVSAEGLKYAESKTLYLKFTDDGKAKLYGNQFKGSMPVEIQPFINFRQNIQKHLEPIIELEQDYIGFKVKVSTSPIWHNKFIPISTKIFAEYKKPETPIYNFAYIDYTPEINFNAQNGSYYFYLNGGLNCTEFMRNDNGEEQCIGRYLYNESEYNTQFTPLNPQAFNVVQNFFNTGEAYLRVFSYYDINEPSIMTFTPITQMPLTYSELALIDLPSIEYEDLLKMLDWRGESKLSLKFNAGSTILHSATIDIPPRNGNPEYKYTHDLTGQNSGTLIIPQMSFLLPQSQEIMRVVFNGEITHNGKTQLYEWLLINCIDSEYSSCGSNN